jgi:hypothetical protein
VLPKISNGQKIISMKKFISIIILLFVIQNIRAQNIYKCNSGEVTFYSKAPVEDITAVSHNMNSILNTSNNEIVFVVPMRSFKFKKALMQEHFNEKYMESDKYPNTTYKGKINGKIDYAKDGEYEITSTGILTIHGVDKPRTEKGKLVIKNGMLTIQSEFNVAIKDHDITVPKLLVQNIAETVNVKFIAQYDPFKKEK